MKSRRYMNRRQYIFKDSLTTVFIDEVFMEYVDELDIEPEDIEKNDNVTLVFKID